MFPVSFFFCSRRPPSAVASSPLEAVCMVSGAILFGFECPLDIFSFSLQGEGDFFNEWLGLGKCSGRMSLESLHRNLLSLVVVLSFCSMSIVPPAAFPRGLTKLGGGMRSAIFTLTVTAPKLVRAPFLFLQCTLILPSSALPARSQALPTKLVALNQHAARGILGPPLTFSACARPLEAIHLPLDVGKKVRLGGCDLRLCIHIVERDFHCSRKIWDARTCWQRLPGIEDDLWAVSGHAHLGTGACRVCLRCAL